VPGPACKPQRSFLFIPTTVIIFTLKFLLVAYFAIGIACCWWGIKSTREMDIQDEESLMLLAILSLSAITLWPLFCVMEGVKMDNPFTHAMGQALSNSLTVFQRYIESRKAA